MSRNGDIVTVQDDRLAQLLAPHDGELGRGLRAVGLGLVGQLAAVGLLASAAWLITTASLRPPVLTLTVAIAGVRLFALLRGTARYGERLASHDLALRALARMRVWAFARIEPLVPGRWPGSRRGDLLARFVSDVDGLQDLYVRVALPFAAAVSTAAITVAVAVMLDPEAGVVLGIGLAVAILAFPIITGVIGAPGGGALAGRRGDRDGVVVELLHGASELAVFGSQAMMATRVLEAERELARQDARASIARGLGHSMGVAIGGLLAAAVVAASLPAFDAGRVSGVVVAVLGFLALASAEAASNLSESFARLAGVLGGARRILALAPAEGTGPQDAGPQDAGPQNTGPQSTGSQGTASHPFVVAPGRVPAIAIDDVSVRYSPDRQPALTHIDLVVAPGKRIALVGESGSGKTTMGHLLLGFVEPTEGQLSFDGVDLRSLDSDVARQLIAWAPQDPHVFHTTLAANLRLAQPQATDADLVAVLGNVGLGPWLTSLPAGVGTMLGERGNTVSGGERQRLGVARALLADRSVLILDEPTAHLDAENASLLRSAVLAASNEKTLIWITHRLVDLDVFDEVITIHRGHVVLNRAGHDLCRAAVGGRRSDSDEL